MQITNAYNANANLNITARVAPPAVNNEARSNTAVQEPQLNNAALNNMQANQQVNVDAVRTMVPELNILLQQFSEWVRVASESKRMEFLYNVLLRQSHESSEMFGTIMDIARRIMRGENVSLDEMRLLAEQNSQLFFAVIVMKEETPDEDEKERRRERERRGKDRRSKSRRRDFNMRSINQSEPRAAVRSHYTVPQDLARHVHSLLTEKSVRVSYDNIKRVRVQPKAINAVIMNPHEVVS